MATPTFGERVEAYLGRTLASDQDDTLSTFLQDAARTLTDILPLSKIERTALLASLNASTGVLAVSSRRIVPDGVTINGKRAHGVPTPMAGEAANTDSIYYADPEEDPAFTINNGNLAAIGWSNGMTGSVLYVPVPVVTAADSSISGWPQESEELVVMGAALRYINKLIQDDITSLSALSTAMDGALPSPPTTLPTPPSAPDVSSHLTQIHTFINTNEDVELAQAEVQEVGARMGVFANDINLYQAEMQGFANQVQAYAAEVGAIVQQYVTKRDLLLASIESLKTLLGNLQRIYYDSLAMQTGTTPGKREGQ